VYVCLIKAFTLLLLQISQSNAWTVALRDVQRDLTGFYKCEVSADAPLFHTEIKSGLMIVVGTNRSPTFGHLEINTMRFGLMV
jgi:hypothetical protein